MKRPSGGRGDYEMAGRDGNFRATDLSERHLMIDAQPFGVFATAVVARVQGGKVRLRLQDGGIQLPRQFEAMMLLPRSRRQEATLHGGRPVIREGQYVMRRIEFTGVALGPAGAEVARLTVGDCTLVSDSEGETAETLNAPERLARIRRVHEGISALQEPWDDLIAAHADALAGGGPLTEDLEDVVQDVMLALEACVEDYGLAYLSGSDPLPLLEQLLDLPDIEMPQSPDLEGEANPGLRLREIQQLRRMAAARGAAAVRFSRDVREAYSATCLFCGLQLAKTKFSRRPGVDSAHILPYSKYDLDVVANGLCLCKNHHWAFDEGFLVLVHEAGAYRVELTDRACQAFEGNPKTLGELERWIGPVNEALLPADPTQRPDPVYLRQLREDMAL